MSLLSIVIPVYNEEESIPHIAPALRGALSGTGVDFEIIFIDDGSTDGTYAAIKAQSHGAANIRGYRFSRNFGKEAALFAGLAQAQGDATVTMDGDLQHPPELLPQMLTLWQEGYEVVEGIKTSKKKKGIFNRFFARLFYKLFDALSGLDMYSSSDFKLLDKRVVGELLLLNEKNTFYRGLSFWVGFRRVKLEYEVAPRLVGKTKWGFFSLLKFALGNIIGFSAAPLQLVTIIGFILTIGSLVLIIQTLVRFLLGYSQEGFTTVIILLLLIGGSLMISLGIIGMYIAKIYDEVKGRPRYIISETTMPEV